MQKKPGSAFLNHSLCFSLLLAGGLVSCQKRSSPRPSADKDPTGLIVPTQPLPPIGPVGGTVQWPNGQVSYTLKIKGRQYLQVNGLIAPASYSRFLEQGSPLANDGVKQELRQSLLGALATLESQVHEQFLMKDIVAETGYYSMWIPYSESLWSKLQNVTELPIPLTLEAVGSDPKELDRIRLQSEQINKLIVAGNSKDTTDGFSGLVRIGVTNEWLQALNQELGEKADGSMVKVGITDTGITFNHPSFQDEAGKPRIAYMKDFTQEGKVYFPDTAKFTVRLGTAQEAQDLGVKEENLLYAEEVSGHVNTVASTPAADGPFLISVPKGSPIVVPTEVRQALQNGSSIKLGFLSETAFNGPKGDSFDLNRNLKKDDLLALLLVAPKDAKGLAEHKAFLTLNPVGTFGADGSITVAKALNLSTAIGLRDFNSSKDIGQSFAEKFGLAFENLTLKSSVDGSDVNTVAVGLVGYDSGTHGSHVAGIIGGRKTLLNDKDLTLARGVAPATNLYSDRVCSNTRGCSASLAIQDLALNAKVDVINMSLGGLSNLNDGYDTQSLLIDRLTQISNTLFVISAGNSGPGLQTIGSPSTARYAISVAASASSDIMGRQSQIGVPTNDPSKDQDFVMSFSSRGPLSNGGFKPNVTAPGTQLSAVSLNQAGRSGTDVYQGTSMAAPTVTGAYALLLDAARRYNKKHPNAQLPTDVLSLRNVLIGSAKPFDVKTFDPGTGQEKSGQYTWIDQGTGILDVPAAWVALKKLAGQQVSTGIEMNGKMLQPVYEVRTSVTNRYGKVYDGKPAPADGITSYGAGLWIDAKAPRPLYSVGIARRLPLAADGMQTPEQQGDAFAKLVSSGEFFKLTTEVHGSNIDWLKVNVIAAANSGEGNNCDALGAGSLLTVVGQGALDAQGGAGVSGTGESTVYVCVDREKLSKLPKGDHGALIRAYRQAADGSVTEPVPAFIIPVYLSLPHETLTAGKAYAVSSAQVKSLGVSRNYLEVPADVSSLRVSLSVNKATADAFGQGQNCSGVYMSVYAADNTVNPPEFDNTAASNCTGPGYSIGPDEELRSKSVAEIVAPKPGLWDMHVLGQARYPLSTYQLRVDYVKAASQSKEVKGGLEALTGSLNVEIKESSTPYGVSASRSSYIIDQAAQTVTAEVKQDQNLEVASRAGVVLRSYPAGAKSVVVTTSGAKGSDIDLEIQECGLAGDACASVVGSGGPTDEETATFTPKLDKAYKFIVSGYTVTEGKAVFQLGEAIAFTQGAIGKVTATQLGSDRFWSIGYSLSKDEAFFQSEIFKKDPAYEVKGRILVASPDLTLAVIPVQIRLN